jgi:hypothetical protein
MWGGFSTEVGSPSRDPVGRVPLVEISGFYSFQAAVSHQFVACEFLDRLGVVHSPRNQRQEVA